MRVLIINDGADTGGGSIKIKQAFDRHAPGWEVRAVRRSDNYIRYPADVEWPARHDPTPEVLRLWAWADVVHMVNGERVARLLPGYDDKPKIVQYRGRGNGARIASALERGVPAYVSTQNLLVPGTRWLPNIGDGDALSALRAAEWHPSTRRHPRLPTLVHAPTVRSLKGTDDLLAALAPARDRVQVDLIEGQTLAECLRRKARGDLLFDQFGPFAGAYGSNAIEAWGLGMPVINMRAGDWMRAWYTRNAGYVPYAEAEADDVAEVILALLEDRSAFVDVAERGREFFHAFHEARVVVARLQAAYEEAIG